MTMRGQGCENEDLTFFEWSFGQSMAKTFVVTTDSRRVPWLLVCIDGAVLGNLYNMLHSSLTIYIVNVFLSVYLNLFFHFSVVSSPSVSL